MHIESKIAANIAKTYFDTKISSADDVLNLARDKHGLEFGRQIRCPVGDMQIPYRQYQYHVSHSLSLSYLSFP